LPVPRQAADPENRTVLAVTRSTNAIRATGESGTFAKVEGNG
jgi:hypothetical protein